MLLSDRLPRPKKQAFRLFVFNQKMRYRNILVVALLLSMSACNRLGVYSKVADLTFNDAALARCVHQTGVKQQWAEVGMFRELRCNNARQPGIESIDEIPKLVELESLDLSFNNIVDASSIANLQRLTVVDFGHNNIVAIPTESRSFLTSLNLDYNKVNELNWLGHYVDLTTLTLSHNQIRSVVGLTDLPLLSSLDLSANKIGDVSGLAAMKNLRALSLANNELKNIDGLSGLTDLEFLDLSNNQINNLGSLKGLTRLVELDLSNNPIKDLTPITQLINLEKIVLDDTEVSSLLPLLTIGRLEHISLRGLSADHCADVQQLIEVFGIDTVFIDSSCEQALP